MCNSTCLIVDISHIFGSSEISLHGLVDGVDVEDISEYVLEEGDEEGGGVRVGMPLVVVEVVESLNERNACLHSLCSETYHLCHVEGSIVRICV